MISVIMPVYNGEKYLSEAIESLLCQTYRDFELIIVDDGSTDKSAAIISTYSKKDKRIKPIYRKHEGLSKTRYAGLLASNGEWINYMDCDDVVDSQILEYMLSCALYHNVEFVQIQNRCFKGNICDVQRDSNGELRDYNIRIVSGTAVISIKNNNDLQFGPWGKLISKKLFLERDVQAWFTEECIRYPLNFFNDFTIIPIIASLATSVALLDYVGYYHRDYDDSISHTFRVTSIHYERVELFDQMICYYERRGLRSAIDSSIVDYFLAALSYWYKGYVTDRNGDDFIKYTNKLNYFYEKRRNIINEVASKDKEFYIKRTVIDLWKLSPSIWTFLIGNLYFKRK